MSVGWLGERRIQPRTKDAPSSEKLQLWNKKAETRWRTSPLGARIGLGEGPGKLGYDETVLLRQTGPAKSMISIKKANYEIDFLSHQQRAFRFAAQCIK